jgi:prevent-host-death family protein
MRTITVEEAKARLSELLEAALQGEELVITGDGGAYRVIVTPVPAPPRAGHRIAGLGKGTVWMSEDFNAPLPDAFWLGDA